MKQTFRTLAKALLVFLSMLALSSVALAKLTKTGSSTAGFIANAPGGLEIDGQVTDLTVADDGTTVTVTVGLSGIDTGLELRNKHTKEDLETDTYPTAKLSTARSALKLGGGKGDAPGKMTIHGVTRDVTFHYSIRKNGDTLQVNGSVPINVEDYGVKPRSYLSIQIKSKVKIYATFQMEDR